MISAGTFKARGVEAALDRAGTGTEQIGVMLSITEGEHAGESITWYGFFTEATAERTIKALRLLGWQGDDLTDLTGIDVNEVSIVIEHEEDNKGKVHARVKWINGPGSLAMKETLDPKDARSLSARMKGMAIASRQGAKPANGTAPQQRRNAEPKPEANPFNPADEF